MHRSVILCVPIILFIILSIIILCLSLSKDDNPNTPDPLLNKSTTVVEGLFIGTRSGLLTVSLPSLQQTKISDDHGYRVAFDWSSRKINWYSHPAKAIKRGYLNGTDVEVVIRGESWGFAVDQITGNIYFHLFALKDIRVCNGMDRCSILARNQNIVHNIAVLASKALMFWTNDTSIVRANMDGTDAKVINSKKIYHFALDEDSDRLYWIGRDQKFIASCDLNGSDERVLLNTTSPVLTAIAVDEERVYFRNSTGHSLHFINKNCTNPSFITITKSDMEQMTLYGRKAHFRSNPCTSSPCSHLCGLKNESFACIYPQ